MKNQISIIFIFTFLMFVVGCSKPKKENAQDDKTITVITDENDKVVEIISDTDEPFVEKQPEITVDKKETKKTQTSTPASKSASSIKTDEKKEPENIVVIEDAVSEPQPQPQPEPQIQEENPVPTPEPPMPIEDKPVVIDFVPAEEITISEEIEVKEKSNLSVGFSFAPEYANRTAKADDALGEFILSFSDNEKAKFGFTVGVSVDYQITNWLSFETGMLFSNKGYKEKIRLRMFEDDAGKEYCFRYNVHYLEVPLKAKFYFVELQKINFYATGGLVPAVYLSSKLKSNADEVSNTNIYLDGSTKFNKLNLSGALGLGCKYQFNNDLFLDIEAGYKHSFFPMDDLALKRKLYSLGVDFTLYYRL